MIEENKNIYISNWLLLITFLVALMIVVGGLTRLTDSGLSITKWNLISGILPPLSNDEWNKSFSLYKEIPEYKLLNSSMLLEEFKVIYWWEYIHRLLGRIIGIFYIIPLLFFTLKKFLNRRSCIVLYLIFFLICFQGFIGWYMVQSGLSERTDVSHYRLSIHLTLAFIILILLIWNYFVFKNYTFSFNKHKISFYLPFFIFLILLQISLGALVSGLDAGLVYQTWPLMNGGYFPNDSLYSDLFTSKAFEVPSLVQFLHRNIAYLLTIFFLIIGFVIFKDKNLQHLRKATVLVFIALFLQILLGIITIVLGAPIFFSSLHQIGSIFLIVTSLNLVFKNYRTN